MKLWIKISTVVGQVVGRISTAAELGLMEYKALIIIIFIELSTGELALHNHSNNLF